MMKKSTEHNLCTSGARYEKSATFVLSNLEDLLLLVAWKSDFVHAGHTTPQIITTSQMFFLPQYISPTALFHIPMILILERELHMAQVNKVATMCQ